MTDLISSGCALQSSIFLHRASTLLQAASKTALCIVNIPRTYTATANMMTFRSNYACSLCPKTEFSIWTLRTQAMPTPSMTTTRPWSQRATFGTGSCLSCTFIKAGATLCGRACWRDIDDDAQHNAGYHGPRPSMLHRRLLYSQLQQVETN
jgi:hypothetical protein